MEAGVGGRGLPDVHLEVERSAAGYRIRSHIRSEIGGTFTVVAGRIGCCSAFRSWFWAVLPARLADPVPRERDRSRRADRYDLRQEEVAVDVRGIREV